MGKRLVQEKRITADDVVQLQRHLHRSEFIFLPNLTPDVNRSHQA